MFTGIPTEAVNVLSNVITMLIAGGGIIWALSGQFTKTRELVDQKIDKLETTLVNKMEYHERHDDSRFTEVKNDVWQLRLEAAAKKAMLRNVNRKLRPDADLD